MLKLNLKIAWRNLLKYKTYTMINIIGLSLGLAGFIFILLFINHEKSYDTWSPELKNVYKMQEYSDYFSSDKKAHWIDEIDQRLANLATNFPEIKAVTVLDPDNGRKTGIKIDDKPAFLQSGLRRVDSLFFKVMPFEFKYGNPDVAFMQEDCIVLKEHLALKYFGDVNPVGRKINVAGGSWNKEENFYTVTGVIKDTETPSVLDFEGLIYWGKRSSFEGENYGTPAEIYVRSNSIKDLNVFNSKLQKAYLPIKDHHLAYYKSSLNQAKKEGNSPILKLTEISEIHQAPLKERSWKDVLKPVVLLSVLLLVVSIINFINLATAQAAGRAKEIGVKKVIGAYRTNLFFQFLIDTLIQCLVAMFIAILLIEILLPTLNGFFSLQLSLFNSSSLVVLIPQLLILVIIVGLLAGAYPSLYLSSYKPQNVLKGNYANGKQGSFIRKGLVAVQLVVSVSFIIGILVINYQLNYLKNRDNGFTADGLINIRSGIGDSGDKYFKQLQRIDGVKYVAFSSSVIGDNVSKSYSFKFKDENKELYTVGIGIDGLQALNVRLLKGRMFSPNVIQDTINNVVINESAAKMFDEEIVGKTILASDSIPTRVIGVIKDIQVEGFESAVKPSLYVVKTNSWKGVGFTVKPTTLVRFDRNKTKTVIAEIDKLFTEMNQFYPASYSFVEDDMATILVDYQRFEKMVALFSMLSLILSLFGLFAVAAFITKQRTKEIAVRKVLGAENTDILVLLNRGYVWIVIIANIIAFPLAYILMKRWLATFAYKIEITPIPFVLAFFASIVITVITVSLQARRAIKANPVKALKYE